MMPLAKVLRWDGEHGEIGYRDLHLQLHHRPVLQFLPAMVEIAYCPKAREFSVRESRQKSRDLTRQEQLMCDGWLECMLRHSRLMACGRSD